VYLTGGAGTSEYQVPPRLVHSPERRRLSDRLLRPRLDSLRPIPAPSRTAPTTSRLPDRLPLTTHTTWCSQRIESCPGAVVSSAVGPSYADAGMGERGRGNGGSVWEGSGDGAGIAGVPEMSGGGGGKPSNTSVGESRSKMVFFGSYAVREMRLGR